MMSGSSCMIACPQNEIARSVWPRSIPQADLNHWRLASRIETYAIGTLNNCSASRVTRSKRSSAGVSRMCSEYNAARRSVSLAGVGAWIMVFPLADARQQEVHRVETNADEALADKFASKGR